MDKKEEQPSKPEVIEVGENEENVDQFKDLLKSTNLIPGELDSKGNFIPKENPPKK